MESIQTNALNSKYINSLLRPEENPFMQEMQSFEAVSYTHLTLPTSDLV